MKKLILPLMVIFLTACDSENWISYPELKCENGEPDFNYGGRDMEEHMREGAKALCSMSGQSFGGEFKCEGTDVLINCK